MPREPIIDNVTDKEKINEQDDEAVDLESSNSESCKPKELETRDIKKIVTSPINLTFKAYQRIICYGMRYANDDMPEKNWREVYGILIGYVEDNGELLVKDAIPMIVGERAGVKYENKQYVDMAQIDESVFSRSIQDKKKDFIIGWFHTHPGFPYQFSSVDHQTQLGYQIPNPYAVSLIFNHRELKGKNFYLGIAALRLLNPDRGLLSAYNYVDLKPEMIEEEMVKKAEKSIKGILKDLPKVLKELDFIDDFLRKKGLARLQHTYGLLLVPKINVNQNEQVDDNNDRYLYEWDPAFFEKSYNIPRFRQKIENEIKVCEEDLRRIKQDEDESKFEHERKKNSRKMSKLLSIPNQFYNKLMDEFSNRIKKIFPYYDYLDTDERKILEVFEETISEYSKVLESLNVKAKFEI